MSEINEFVQNNEGHPGVTVISQSEADAVLDVSSASDTVKNMMRANVQNGRNYPSLTLEEGHKGNAAWWRLA